MRLWKKLCFINALFFFTLACNKNIKGDYPKEFVSEKYAGAYEMYDPIEQVSYLMLIQSAPNSGNLFDNWDSLYFTNFGNRFDFGMELPTTGELTGTVIQPLVDNKGNKWNFGNVHYPDTLNRINVLLQDSIYLFFQIDNTAYW